jgi:site-specific DNA recombinase
MPGHLVIDEQEADLVRMLYGWLIDEQMTLRQLLKRLNTGPYLPRSGRHAWSPSTVHHILADPVYAGTAYANRYAYVAAAKPRSRRSSRSGEATCRRLKPREQWIAISVPALVNCETWDRAQAQLARNARLSFRNNSKHDYLLRCLLTCEMCGLTMFGVTRPASAHKPARQYYECRGQDCILSARTAACPSRAVKAEDIEAAVWQHVTGMLTDPDRLVAQFDHMAATTEAGTAREQAANSTFGHGWIDSHVLTSVCSMPTRLVRSAWPNCRNGATALPRSAMPWNASRKSGRGYAKTRCNAMRCGRTWPHSAPAYGAVSPRRASPTSRRSCSW